jgi:hypothetical protein
MERKKPDNLLTGLRPIPGVAVVHPAWCDLALCTATPDAATGQAHRSAAVVMATDGPGRLRTEIGLSQAHAPWPTDTYAEIRVVGLTDTSWRTVSGRGLLTVRQAASLGEALRELAAAAGEAGR